MEIGACLLAFPFTLSSGDSDLPALQRAYPRLLVRSNPLVHGPPGEFIFDFTCPKLAPQALDATPPPLHLDSYSRTLNTIVHHVLMAIVSFIHSSDV